MHELQSAYRLAVCLAYLRRSLRPVCLVDSIVTRCAASKGRSSSRKLSAVLRKLGALCVSAGLYFSLPFVPTRLNSSDDPTRGESLRERCEGLDLDSWSLAELYKLSQLPKLRRWASNWVRLVLLFSGPAVLDLSDRSLFRFHSRDASRAPGLGLASSSTSLDLSPAAPLDLPASHGLSQCDFPLDFDSTLGFPGEGPSWSCLPRLFFLISTSCVSSVSGSLWPGVLAFFSVAPVLAMDNLGVLLRNSADVGRAALRRSRPPLPQGKPVLQITSDNRGRLLQQFFQWLSTLGIRVDDFFWNLESICRGSMTC